MKREDFIPQFLKTKEIQLERELIEESTELEFLKQANRILFKGTAHLIQVEEGDLNE